MNDDESDGEDEDESTNICCWAFFKLDDDHEIVHMVPHAQLTMEQNNRMQATTTTYSCTMRDLCSMGETLNPPKLIWEV